MSEMAHSKTFRPRRRVAAPLSTADESAWRRQGRKIPPTVVDNYRRAAARAAGSVGAATNAAPQGVAAESRVASVQIRVQAPIGRPAPMRARARRKVPTSRALRSIAFPLHGLAIVATARPLVQRMPGE